MRIGDVAKECGVGVETIRFYEQKGLILQPTKPQTGGFRDYSIDVVRRIKFIRSAQQLGFSLNEVSELLNLAAGNTTCCSDVRQRAEAKREEVQIKIDNLKRIKAALDDLIDVCPGKGSARVCSILKEIHSGVLCLTPIKQGDNNDG